MKAPRRTARVIAFVAALSVVVFDQTAGSAATPTNVTVTAGAQPAATALKVAAVTRSSPVFKDNRSGFNVQCAQVSFGGTAKVGSQAPSNFSRITNSLWSHCIFAGGSATLTHTPSSIWNASATSMSAPSDAAASAPASGQATSVSITGITFSVKVGACTFTVVGSMTSRYTNGTPSTITTVSSSLSVGKITLSGGATTCVAGSVQPGDTFSLSFTSNVSAAVAASGADASPLWIRAQ